MRPTWEYATLTRADCSDSEKYGRDGWELITVVSEMREFGKYERTFYFKRPCIGNSEKAMELATKINLTCWKKVGRKGLCFDVDAAAKLIEEFGV